MLSLAPRDTGMGWRIDCLESRFSEKGKGVLEDTKWNVHPHYGLWAKQANCVLVCMKKNIASRSGKITFIYSALVKPHL